MESSRYKGCSRYVGHVGALAVALGLGGAVIAGAGAAWASEGSSDTGTSASSSSSSSSSSSEGASTAPADKSAPTPSSPDASTADPGTKPTAGDDADVAGKSNSPAAHDDNDSADGDSTADDPPAKQGHKWSREADAAEVDAESLKTEAAAEPAVTDWNDLLAAARAAALADRAAPERAAEWHEVAGRMLLDRGKHREAIAHLERSLREESGDDPVDG